MKKIKLFSALAFIALFVSFLSSCSSNERTTTEQDVVSSANDTNLQSKTDEEKMETKEVTFIPLRIEVTPEKENPNNICGEGGYKCHTYETYVYLIGEKDSAEIHLCTVVSALETYSAELGKEESQRQYNTDKNTLADLKKVYNKLTKTKPENLIVTLNGNGYKLVVRENIPITEKKKIGEAYLREEIDNVIWQE